MFSKPTTEHTPQLKTQCFILQVRKVYIVQWCHCRWLDTPAPTCKAINDKLLLSLVWAQMFKYLHSLEFVCAFCFVVFLFFFVWMWVGRADYTKDGNEHRSGIKEWLTFHLPFSCTASRWGRASYLFTWNSLHPSCSLTTRPNAIHYPGESNPLRGFYETQFIILVLRS